MKVLLIEDDVKTASFIRKGLRQAGYTVEWACDGAEGLFKAATESFDVAIVDVMLPKLDGLSLVKKMREKKIVTPVIILSAKASVEDRIAGFNHGSDDYLVKPFSFSELLVRIQAILRRSSGVAATEPTTLKVADLSIDLSRNRVFRGGERIDIQPLEYALLEYLMRNSGRVVSKTMIMENVWEYCFDPQTNVVESRVCRLREKVDRNFDKKLIHTVRGFGYVLEERG